MKRLGETKPALKSSVVAVFIASEENSSIPGVGVDMLVKDKLLDKLKSGPLLSFFFLIFLSCMKLLLMCELFLKVLD